VSVKKVRKPEIFHRECKEKLRKNLESLKERKIKSWKKRKQECFKDSKVNVGRV